MILADTPTLGLLIGLPVAMLMFLAISGVAVWGFLSDGPEVGVCAALIALVLGLGTAAAFFPYQHDYHFWQQKSGAVERVSKRLVPTGDKGGMEEKYVVTLHGQPYGVTDTRAALLKSGDHVVLNCKKSYQFMSRSGWDCRWA